MTTSAEYYRSRLSGAWQLLGSNCGNCGEKHFPQRLVCPDCGHGGVRVEKPEQNLLAEMDVRGQDGGNGWH